MDTELEKGYAESLCPPRTRRPRDEEVTGQVDRLCAGRVRPCPRLPELEVWDTRHLSLASHLPRCVARSKEGAWAGRRALDVDGQCGHTNSLPPRPHAAWWRQPHTRCTVHPVLQTHGTGGFARLLKVPKHTFSSCEPVLCRQDGPTVSQMPSVLSGPRSRAAGLPTSCPGTSGTATRDLVTVARRITS